MDIYSNVFNDYTGLKMLIHPCFIYFIAAVLVSGVHHKARKWIQVATPLLAMLTISKFTPRGLEPANDVFLQLGEFSVHWVHADKLSLIFVYVFLLFSFFANVFALHQKQKYIHVAANVYVGSSIGAVLAGDLVVLFIFWEIMAIASALLIWNRRKPTSMNALFRYLLVHGAGGLCFFTGVLMRYNQGDALTFGPQMMDTAGCLLFLAFAINAALVPLHAWLPDAYPAGTAEGSVYLCTFTTKVAVYAFARGFAGSELLVILGVVAAIYGVVYALMENDIRRLLSYHIICQVGYMVIGIGLGTHLSINGGVGHAVGNILFKGLLFMAAGSILITTSRSKLSELGGLFKILPILFVFHMIGSFAIAGLPGLNGYITKSLLVSAAIHEHKGWLELVLLIVAVGTFMSIGLKLTYFAFFHQENSVRKFKPLPGNCVIAMAGAAMVCLIFGLFPQALYHFLPYKEHYNAFTPDHVLQTLQLLLGTFLGFLVIRPLLHTKSALTLDIDWFYRKGGPLFVKGLCFPLRYGQESVQASWTGLIHWLHTKIVPLCDQQKLTTVGYPLLFITTASILIALFALTS